MKVHLVWIPKYRRKIPTGDVAIRARDLIRQIAQEHEIAILSGKAAGDRIHVRIAWLPHVAVSRIAQRLKAIRSRIMLQEFVNLRSMFWGRQFRARRYLAVIIGNLTDEVVAAHIDEQEDVPVHDASRFVIDILPSYHLPGGSS